MQALHMLYGARVEGNICKNCLGKDGYIDKIAAALKHAQRDRGGTWG